MDDKYRIFLAVLFVMVLLGFVLRIGLDSKHMRVQRRIETTVMCLGGIQYYQGDRYLAPVFGPDSKVKLCGGSK